MKAYPPSPARAPFPGRLVVVTVNYRTADYLVRCLASLEAERELLPGLEVVAVDNASGDGSLEVLGRAVEERGWGDWVRILSAEENGGFAAGNNLALAPLLAEEAAPAYVCLLNPDTEVYPGALATLTAFLEAHPRAGFAGPCTEVGRGNVRGSAFRFPGIVNSFDEGLHLGSVSRLLARWKLAPDPRSSAHPTDWLSGGCLLVRPEVFRQVGLFDEGYFLYYEEVDLMRRAGRVGWESWYVPEARIVHFAGASTGLTGGERARHPRPLVLVRLAPPLLPAQPRPAGAPGRRPGLAPGQLPVPRAPRPDPRAAPGAAALLRRLRPL